jgi:hypothetical protein
MGDKWSLLGVSTDSLKGPIGTDDPCEGMGQIGCCGLTSVVTPLYYRIWNGYKCG